MTVPSGWAVASVNAAPAVDELSGAGILASARSRKPGDAAVAATAPTTSVNCCCSQGVCVLHLLVADRSCESIAVCGEMRVRANGDIGECVALEPLSTQKLKGRRHALQEALLYDLVLCIFRIQALQIGEDG